MIPTDEDLYEWFHLASNNQSVGPGDETDRSRSPVEYTQFPGAPTIDLDRPASDAGDDSDLHRALADRRSPDGFADEPVDRADLTALLVRGAGITERAESDADHRRAYPSGGARYPLETYACVLSGADCPEGLYHYDVRETALATLREDVGREELDFLAHSALEEAPLVVFVTATFERTTRKYGDRGYRLVMQESGHLVQNLCLLAADRGLATRPIAGFVEDDADAFLERYGDETTIYAALIGYPSSRTD